jgi:hypothetical protein
VNNEPASPLDAWKRSGLKQLLRSLPLRRVFSLNLNLPGRRKQIDFRPFRKRELEAVIDFPSFNRRPFGLQSPMNAFFGVFCHAPILCFCAEFRAFFCELAGLFFHSRLLNLIYLPGGAGGAGGFGGDSICA